MSLSKLSSNDRIEYLDGLRSIAVILVIIAHYFQFNASYGFILKNLGRFGVEIFFTLSGYLITLLLIAEKSKYKTINLKNFYLRRAFKLIPALYVFLLAHFILFPADCSLLAYLPPLSFTQSYFRYAGSLSSDHTLSCNSINHTWTLSIELLFYLIWPPIIAYTNHRWTKQIALTLVLLTSVMQILDRATVSDNLGYLVAWYMPLRLPSISNSLGLFAGAYLATSEVRSTILQKTRSNFSNPDILLSFLLVVLFGLNYSVTSIPALDKASDYLTCILATTVAFFILRTMVVSPTSLARRYISLPGPVWIGQISYSIYLWQQPLSWDRHFLIFEGALGLVNAAVLSILFAAVSFYLIEKPLQNMGRKFFPPQKKNNSLQVLAFPAFKNQSLNPYNFRLYTSLQELGVNVSEYSLWAMLSTKPDILHIHWPEFLVKRRLPRWLLRLNISVMSYLIRWHKMRGAKIVWTVHNPNPHENRKKDLTDAWLKDFASLVDLNIFHSENNKTQYLSIFPGMATKKNVMIAHGHYRFDYPCSVSKGDARKYLHLNQEQKIVLIFGAIRPYKGLEATLVQLKNSACDPSNKNLMVLIVGASMDQDYANQLVGRFQCDPLFSFVLKNIAAGDVQYYYQASDLVVLSYESIGFSGAAALAMSFSRHTLAPSIGSLPEIAAAWGVDNFSFHNGTITKDVLEAALTKAFQDSQKHFLVPKNWVWRNIATDTLDAYRKVIK